MKRTSIHISIPTPCHESWASMDAAERGAFCHSCQKEVIDFSAMTDREVIEYLSKNKTECGRFRKDQVDTKLSMGLVRNGFLKWKAFALATLSLFAFKSSSAFKNKPATIQTSRAKTTDTSSAPLPAMLTITGKVRDSISQMTLDGARIAILENNAPISWESYIHPSPGNFGCPTIETKPGTMPAVVDTPKSPPEIITDTSGAFYLRTNGFINGNRILLQVRLNGYMDKEISIDPRQPIQSFIIDLVPVSKEPFSFILGKMRVK